MPSHIKEKRAALRAASRPLCGHPPKPPAQLLLEASEWCQEHEVEYDHYGAGAVIEDFEQRIATLLGFEAARFMPSGKMAQLIALRIWCERAGLPHFGMHPTSHVELHEEHGYAHLHSLRTTLVGPGQSPLLAEHLGAVAEPLAVLLTELPIREAGGQLPTWDQLQALKAAAKKRPCRLHLDGARLWECAPAYERPLNEITAGFDSCYVSFYKGIGALPGSMLLGPADFIAEAALWQKRQGGTLYTQLPAVASAEMQLDARLARMPAWHARARALAECMNEVAGVRTLPEPPHTNMFHGFFAKSPEDLLAARDRVAQRSGLWLFGGARPADVPGWSRWEFTVGEAACELDQEEVAAAFRSLMA